MNNVIESTKGSEGVSRGFVEVPGGNVWYKAYGLPSDIPPVLTLHGGPGYPHPDLYPLVDLYTKYSRPVVLYDQLGAGNSDRPNDPNLWNINRFVEEVGLVHDALKDRFKFKEMHLFGHSWGSTLATEYFLQRKPEDIKSLILASPFLSGELFRKDVARLVDEIEPGLSGRIPVPGTPEYSDLETRFNALHVARLDPIPRQMRVTDRMVGHEVYEALQGPSEFNMTGTLAGYEGRDKLNSIDIPVLFTCGRFDEITPESTEIFHSLTPHSEMKVFENSAHMAQFEERELFVRTINDFISKVNQLEVST